MPDFDRYRTVSISRRHDRPNRPWLATWTALDEHGRWRRHRRAMPTRQLAIAFKVQMEERLNSALYPLGRRTWNELLNEYNVHIAAQAKATRYFTWRALACFATIIGEKRLCDITVADCERYFAELSDGVLTHRDPTPAAMRQDYIALHAFFETWKRRDYVAKNPMSQVPKPQLESRLIELPSLEQCTRLLEVLPGLPIDDAQAWHILILLAMVTGIDRDDLLKIRLDAPRPPHFEPFTVQLEVDAEHFGLLAARRQKTGKLRLFGLPPFLCDRIARRMTDLPVGSTHLFPWLNFPRKAWDKIRIAAGWQQSSAPSIFVYDFATLRKVCGTQEAERAALLRARDLLGHSSERTTRDHYVGQKRLALAVAKQVTLPNLPPLPTYVPVKMRRGMRAPRPMGSAPSADRT